jgi:hypothetical protein
MKGLMFLSLIGAVIYGALVVSHDTLSTDAADNGFAGTLGDPGARHLRSWGTDLPGLVASQNTSLPTLNPGMTAATSESSQPSAPAEGVVPVAQATSSSAQDRGTAPAAAEWVKVTLAAKVHSEASVSSPVLFFYPAGTALQVTDRQNGWVQVIDPTSGAGGWIFEQYLLPAAGPVVTQTALATSPTATKTYSEPARTKVQPSAKKRVRAPKPAVRGPEEVALAQFDRRWDRRAGRRNFGLFFFGRFARNDAEYR